MCGYTHILNSKQFLSSLFISMHVVHVCVHKPGVLIHPSSALLIRTLSFTKLRATPAASKPQRPSCLCLPEC